MADQRALDLRRTQPVAADLDHVVHAPDHPDIPVLVAPRAVAGHVHTGEARPIVLHVAVGIAVDGAHHARPRALDHQIALFVGRSGVTLFVQHVHLDAGEWQRRTARLQRRARQRRDHEVARFRLPPRIHDRAALLADHAVIPAPRLRVDRLAHTAQQPQRAQVVAIRPRVTEAHQAANGGRRGVHHRNAVPLHDVPPAVRERVVWPALVYHTGHAQQQRPVDDVAVPCHPAGIGGTPPRIVVLQVEHPFERRGNADHVAAVRMQDRFGLTGRAAGVQQVKRIFGIHLHRLDVRVRDGQVHQVVIPQVTARLHVHVLTGALDHDHGLHGWRALKRLVHDVLQRHDVAAQPRAVGGDGDRTLAVLDPPVQRLDRKAAVNHGVHRADLGAGQHRDHDLRDAAHVDRDAIAFFDAHRAQHAGEAAHLAVKLLVGVGALLVVLAFPDQSSLVAPPRLLVAVERIGHDVRLAAHEPLIERRVRFIERRVPRLGPLELLVGDSSPRPREILLHLRADCIPVFNVCLSQNFVGRVINIAGAVSIPGHCKKLLWCTIENFL